MIFRIFSIVSALSIFGATADASEILHLPPADHFLDIATAVERPAAEPRWTCSATPERVCPCVTVPGDLGSVTLYELVRTENGLAADRLEWIGGRAGLSLEDIQITVTSDGISLQFAGGLWWTRQPTSQVLSFGNGNTEIGGGHVEGAVHELVWYGTTEVADIDGQCPPERDGLSISSFSSTTRRATARRAELAEGQWDVETLRLQGSFPMPVGRLGSGGAPLAGPMPATLNLNQSGARFTAAYHLGGLPLSVRGIVDSIPAGGIGAAIWTTPVDCDAAGPDCGYQVFTVDGLADLEANRALHLSGTASVGDGYRHLSVVSDEVHVSTRNMQSRELNPSRWATSLRAWRSARLGLSMSGEDHGLSAGAALFDEPDKTALLPTRPTLADRQIWLRYGTRLDLGEPGRAEIGVEHRELSPRDFEERLTVASLRVDRRFGSHRRIWFRPTLRGLAGIGVAGGTEGSVARTRLVADLLVDGGVALRGHPGPLTHDITIRGYAGRRNAFDENLPDELEATSLSDNWGPAVAGFHVVGGQIDQGVSTGEGPQLRVSKEILFFDDGRGRDWSPSTRLGLEYSQGRKDPRFVFRIDGLCRGWRCKGSDVTAGMQLRWTERFASSHILGLAAPGGSKIPIFDRGLRGFGTDLSTPSGVDPEGPRALFHATSIRVRWARWRSRLGIFTQVGDLGGTGMQAAALHFWPELGWGLGFDIAVRPGTGSWTSTLGLMTTNL